MDGGLKEDSDAISASLSHENDRSQSQLSPAPVPQESVAAIDSQFVTLTPTTLMKSALDDPRRPAQVVVTDSRQE
jgi:hypothetical protein